MTRGQRNLIAVSCTLIAVATHFYVGDWKKSDEGLLGKVVGYNYYSADPLTVRRESHDRRLPL